MMLHYYSFHISYIYSCVSFMPLCLLYKSLLQTQRKQT